MPDDRLAEGLPVLRIDQGELVCGARHADRLRRDADTPAFQIGERDAISLAFRAEPVLDRNLQVLEMNLAGVRGVLPHLALDPADPVARPRGLDDEGRNAPLAAARLGAGGDPGDGGILPGRGALL